MFATRRDHARAPQPRPHWPQRARRAITDALGRWLDDFAVPRVAIDDLDERTLADIGVRRSDLDAIRSGVVPRGLIGQRRQPRAQIRVLRRATCGQPRHMADDVSAAA